MKTCFINKLLVIITLWLFAYPLSAQNVDTTIYDKQWKLIQMNNRKVNYKNNRQPITLIITQENEYASGSSGCNTYVSQVVIKRNHIMFREIGSTKMACPDDYRNDENNYLNNLNEVDSFKVIDEDLYLYKNDRCVLVYSKW